MHRGISQFTVLIERRAVVMRALLATAMLAMGVVAALVAQPAAAQGAGQRKMARDLEATLDSSGQGARKARWVRERHGQRSVQVVFVAETNDREMTALKAEISRVGGSVDVAMPALGMLTATVPARQLKRIADRADVRFAAPNRGTRRTASALETITGATTSGVRTGSTKTTYSGLDGTGIGIAIVDSGVMKAHEAFNNATGQTRVTRNVQTLTTTLADWTNGYDWNTSLQPGSTALANYEASINNANALVQDGYGHGTHVASVAAGRPVTYNVAPDLTGIAPNASIYDVKVLNDQGMGTLSDALEGIQWVIYHAKEYNIRVMNLSLAMDSTDSWIDDPLCMAVRSATAMGITVVVAAGNYGKAANGKDNYGTIASPGNDPSVITVGSVNTKGTHSRNDDVVNQFSSRGPTRGATVNAWGQRTPDNLLKPDLVAPGNAIVAAAATRASSSNPTWNAIAAANYASLEIGRAHV